METEHSPTPWANDMGYISSVPINGTVALTVQRNYGLNVMLANADRIVACVNACEGIDNADLTHGCYQKLVEKHVEVCFAKQDLEAQQDELLKHFKFLVEWLENRHPNYPNREAIGAVIAKAEGVKL